MCWGAHASGVLVSASRRNELSFLLAAENERVSTEVRDREDAIASTRDACAPQNRSVILLKFAAASR